MANLQDGTSRRFTASDLVSNVTEALQAWRNADHKDQAEAWRKYTIARRMVVDLVVKGLEVEYNNHLALIQAEEKMVQELSGAS